MPTIIIKQHWMSGGWLAGVCKVLEEAAGNVVRHVIQPAGNAIRNLFQPAGNAARQVTEDAGDIDIGKDCT